MSQPRFRQLNGDSSMVQTFLIALCTGIVSAMFISFLVIQSNGFNTSVSNLPNQNTVNHPPEFPLTAFGSILIESYSPIFQTDAIYELFPKQGYNSTFGTGTFMVNNSAFVMNTGSGQYSYSVLQSRKRLRYRSGQGSRVLFTSKFNEPIQNSYQVAGLGSSTDGIYFGYDLNGKFGILHSNRGKRETIQIMITTGSSTTEDIQLTLGGITYNIPVTNSGSALRTAWEISAFDFIAWLCQPISDSVLCIANDARPITNSYSISGTTVNGTFVNIQSGKVPDNTWVYQEDWNEDPMDGTGRSGIILNPQLFNVYSMSLQYLGAGAIRCFVEGQNSTFNLVHIFRFPNSRTQTTFGIPSFPFTAAVYSAGSTTPIQQEIGSFAGFIEGKRVFNGDRFAITNVLISTVDNSAYYLLFSLENTLYYNGKGSQGIINVLSIGGASQSTGSITLFLFRFTIRQHPKLNGNPNFQPYAPGSALLIDTAAETLTINDFGNLVWSVDVASLSSADTIFGTSTTEELTLQPGEILCLCARTTSGTADFVTASMSVSQDY